MHFFKRLHRLIYFVIRHFEVQFKSLFFDSSREAITSWCENLCIFFICHFDMVNLSWCKLTYTWFPSLVLCCLPTVCFEVWGGGYFENVLVWPFDFMSTTKIFELVFAFCHFSSFWLDFMVFLFIPGFGFFTAVYGIQIMINSRHTDKQIDRKKIFLVLLCDMSNHSCTMNNLRL